MEQGFLCDPPHLPEQQRCGWRPLLEPRGPDPVAFAAREAVLGAGGRGGRLARGPGSSRAQAVRARLLLQAACHAHVRGQVTSPARCGRCRPRSPGSRPVSQSPGPSERRAAWGFLNRAGMTRSPGFPCLLVLYSLPHLSS